MKLAAQNNYLRFTFYLTRTLYSIHVYYTLVVILRVANWGELAAFLLMIRSLSMLRDENIFLVSNINCIHNKLYKLGSVH